MRFGVCGNLAASKPDKTGIEIIEKLKECGYDYIELPISEIMALPVMAREEIVARVEGCGLRSEVTNNFFPRGMKLTGPAVDRPGIRAYYEEALIMAKRLGAEYMVFGSPFAKSYPLGFDKEKAMDQLIDLTAEVDAFAASIGMRILIEPIHIFECNIVNTFAEGVRLAKAIDAKATDVLLDFYHMTRNQEDIETLLPDGRRYLRHVHFACPFLPGEGERVFPLFADEWPAYRRLAEILKELEYTGRISIEARTSDFDAHAGRSLAVMKELFQ